MVRAAIGPPRGWAHRNIEGHREKPAIWTSKRIWTSQRSAGAGHCAGRGRYGQYCPIARGAEIFAERWTPVIVRNLHLGCETFGEILVGAPWALPHPAHAAARPARTLRNRRQSASKFTAAVTGYRLTTLGPRSASGSAETLGEWGARWLEIAPEILDPIRSAVVDVQRAPPGTDSPAGAAGHPIGLHRLTGPTSGPGRCSSTARPRSARRTQVWTKTSTSPPTPRPS